MKKRLAGPAVSEFTSFLRGNRDNDDGAYFPPKHFGSHASSLVELLVDPDHPKNTKEDHWRLFGENELMVLCPWVDSNDQFCGSYYGRHHSHWLDNADPKKPAYRPGDFRREATFDKAVGMPAPSWRR